MASFQQFFKSMLEYPEDQYLLQSSSLFITMIFFLNLCIWQLSSLQHGLRERISLSGIGKENYFHVQGIKNTLYRKKTKKSDWLLMIESQTHKLCTNLYCQNLIYSNADVTISDHKTYIRSMYHKSDQMWNTISLSGEGCLPPPFRTLTPFKSRPYQWTCPKCTLSISSAKQPYLVHRVSMLCNELTQKFFLPTFNSLIPFIRLKPPRCTNLHLHGIAP